MKKCSQRTRKIIMKKRKKSKLLVCIGRFVDSCVQFFGLLFISILGLIFSVGSSLCLCGLLLAFA